MDPSGIERMFVMCVCVWPFSLEGGGGGWRCGRGGGVFFIFLVFSQKKVRGFLGISYACFAPSNSFFG